MTNTSVYSLIIQIKRETLQAYGFVMSCVICGVKKSQTGHYKQINPLPAMNRWQVVKNLANTFRIFKISETKINGCMLNTHM